MRLKFFAAVIALQLSWIAGVILVQETRLRGAPTVLLECAPVDPRDPIGGDYIALGYKISLLSRDLFQPVPTNRLEDGQTVFVLLEKRGKFWTATQASILPLKSRPDQILIRGALRWVSGGQPEFPLRANYGLERYFVREGHGNPSGTLTVEAAIDKSGRASIKEVFVDGVRFRAAMVNQ